MDHAKEFLLAHSGIQAYGMLFMALIGCGIGMPMNSDLLLITASVLAALGFFKLSILIPLAFFALLTGDTINFFVARRFGPSLLRRPPFRWLLSEAKVRSAERFIQERGEKIVFFIRFLPLIRTALFFTAGSLQVRVRTFYVLNGTSTLLYLLILMNLAYTAGENADALFATFKQFQILLLCLFFGGAVFLIARLNPRRTP